MIVTRSGFFANHYGFWVAYSLARAEARNNPVKENPYQPDWSEYRGWEAGMKSMGVRQ